MAGRDRKQHSGTLGELKELVREAGIHLKPENPPAAPKPVPAARPAPAPEPPPASDEDLFDQAMCNVKRASWDHHRVTVPPPPAAPPVSPELEERLLMQEAIDGELAPAVQQHPEYIEGWVGVIGKRYLTSLRNGIYSIQGQLDLHGFNRVEARAVVEEFVVRMSRFQSCCVKIIHGRGINSPDDRAILKESLQRWLSTRRMARYVVAFASAPLNDGGVGAVYVLLKKQ